MSTDIDYPALSRTLQESLRLHVPAVAITLRTERPANVPAFAGQTAAGCRFWQEGAAGRFVTTAKDHSLCAIGLYTHNLPLSDAGKLDLTDALAVFKDLGYVRDEDLPFIPTTPFRVSHVIYEPPATVQECPHVVLLIVNARQTLILSEAVSQVEMQHAPAMGRPACALVPQVIKTGRAAMSLGCCGARAYLDSLTDDVALFALPGEMLERYVARIDALASANSVLSKFHRMRLADVEAGKTPTVKESLAALQAAV